MCVSLFQIDCSLNGKLITYSDNNYPYKAHIETLLGEGSARKNTRLQSCLYYKDTASQMGECMFSTDGGLELVAFLLFGVVI